MLLYVKILFLVLGSCYTWELLRMGVADAIFTFDCGDELVYQRVRLRRVRPVGDFRLQMLDQLLIRRVELHSRGQPDPVLQQEIRNIISLKNSTKENNRFVECCILACSRACVHSSGTAWIRSSDAAPASRR